ncbi:LemA family protein [candidate division KSB1 bacterium]|nr:LemA family protein [candidate division KSB1 bacterium]NIR69991.1 LemA family protein [candidate division KSB1 bacterium]NIS23014.1 LemA family protein [candidate division KSB1 bacterium]NIT69872.1 LemA family protein [candidate division KSB1 bacterium]NIU23521.1 LemA family protein [candidate division KSB1 bacterium]
MSKGLKIFLGILAVFVLIGIMTFVSVKNTYNDLVRLEEETKEKWSQVQNVYQRRADLIPNLVQTVKGYAAHERETLEAVTQARASATRPEINVNAEKMLQNPQLFQQFEQAQSQLTSALSRLLVTIERYPNLKANQNFIRLQDELAGTENRIAVERRRYNQTIRNYNQKIRSFPTVMFASMLGFQQRPYFEASPEAQEAPEVDFSTSSN